MVRKGALSGIRSVRRGWWGRINDVAIVLLAAVTTACAGLVFEDALPLSPVGVRFDPRRWLVLVAVAVALTLLLWIRQRRQRFSGTLYYVRYLMEWMGDWRLDQLRAVQEGFLDKRVVTAWCTTPQENDVLDIARDTGMLTRELQSTMNGDRADTGFNLAPNLLLPAGVALGYDLYAWDDLSLEELFDGEKPVTLSWTLDDEPKWLGFESPTTREQALTNGAAVVVTVDLTGQGRTSFPPGSYGHHYRVAVYAEPGNGTAAKSKSVNIQSNPGSPVGTDSEGAALAPVHPVVATREVVRAVREALHRHPDRCVVLAARVPKTVAVAVGHGLANGGDRFQPGCGHARCKQEACLHPWRRLVVALFDQESTQGARFILTRVHDGQPSAEHIHRSVFGTA